ncbi:putative copper-exporting ATPase [Mycobacterium ulcerans str. Harvey]|uniref:Copper-exporting ATPase n=1 Tax=Mycobacterium ulcerans str. Harvey TaxID=1299332 RepID=A0ABN0QTG9_MYCUL|nr:putative copper-exporting ATPase [Mycobacterium ulcerans str. Harvey]
MRDAHREEVEQARRCQRDRQLRDRAGHRHCPAGYDPQILITEVEKAGYAAALPQHRQQPAAAATTDTHGVDPELASLRGRLVGAVVLAGPVILMAMLPALQFRYWQWASLALAAPVIVWAGRPFHQAAWVNLKHGTATMDTLISVGTLAAFLWSLYALFLGTAGEPGIRHPFELTITPGDGASNIYLEVAAGVIAFVLAAGISRSAPSGARAPPCSRYSSSAPKT